jgi:hypothetical protein
MAIILPFRPRMDLCLFDGETKVAHLMSSRGEKTTCGIEDPWPHQLQDCTTEATCEACLANRTEAIN